VHYKPNRGASSGIRGGNSSLRRGDIPNTTAYIVNSIAAVT